MSVCTCNQPVVHQQRQQQLKMDHHDHGSHGHSAMGMGHSAKSMSELHHPDHGSYEGHIVPGAMSSQSVTVEGRAKSEYCRGAAAGGSVISTHTNCLEAAGVFSSVCLVRGVRVGSEQQ